MDRLARNHTIAFALIAVLALAAFYPTFANGFVCDDLLIVVHNPRIRSLGSIGTILTSSYWGDQDRRVSLYRPLTILSFAADHFVAGFTDRGALNPAVYHGTNLLAHILCTIALYVLLRRYFVSPDIALAACALFAVHPVHGDVVYGAVNRSDSLAALFFVIAFICYAGWRRAPAPERATWRLVASCVSFFIALGFKEMAVTLPVALFIFDRLAPGNEEQRRYGRRSSSFYSFLEESARRYGGFVIVIAVHVFLRFVFVGRLGTGLQTFAATPIPTRVLTMCAVVGDYFGAFFFPVFISADYPYNQWAASHHSSIGGRVVAGLLLIGAVVFLAIVLARRGRRVEFFWLLFCLVTLLPVLNIVPISIVKADRLLYLPSAGFCCLAAVAFSWLWRRARPVAACGGAVVLAAFVLLCQMQGTFHMSDEHFAMHLCAVNPHFPFAHYLRAKAFAERGEHHREIGCYGAALALMPEYKNALHSRAVAFYVSGDFAGAEADLKRLVKLPPVNPRAYNNLGRVLAEQGKLRDAVAQYSAAIGSVHAALEGHFGRFAADSSGIEREDRFRELVAALLTCAEDGTVSNPIMPWEYAEFLGNRGLASFDLGEYDQARKDMVGSLLLAPPDMNRPEGTDSFVFTLTRIAECDFKLGRFGEAALDFRRLAELQPGQAAKLLLREVECWIEAGRLDDARESADRLKAAGGELPAQLMKKLGEE